MERPLEIFFSYAHADESLMNDVRRQLIVYERNGRILKWHDRMIPPGTEWREEIDGRLEVAQMILLFMSPHFIESRYCYEVEGQVALRRHNAGEAKVIPIVLRPCAWEETPFGRFQALPRDAQPISRWPDRDEACLDAARGVMRTVDQLTFKPEYPSVSVAAPKSAATVDPAFVYCARCGHVAGEAAGCTGQYRHHNFKRGSKTDYCSRCGVQPGSAASCTGQYTHHSFTDGTAGKVHCSRCGASVGKKTVCTGQYTHHDFTRL